jgi:hypothetical protein
MALKPWYNVVTPREDLREGKPLDAAEFAVHLDQVRDGRANTDYQNPKKFFERTYLTENLTSFAAEVIRRLSGEHTESSSVFNMTTQFGGGKTHALTLLYHLAEHGPAANNWMGLDKLLSKARVTSVSKAKTAVFVGTEFDSLNGRGGDDGTPIRKTPWGEIAFQLGGVEGLNLVAEHERRMIAPAGDVIRKMMPKDQSCLILMDELMNYVSRNRTLGLSSQLYDFLQNLSETARGEKNVVLAVSIPASELEMTADDQEDYDRFKKLLNRVGKSVIMSAETETSEIIRRRLFEWDSNAISQNGRVMLTQDAKQTCREYAEWVNEHRQQIPNWFPVDNAQEAFEATYPFHPMVLSVFERKWRSLPRFQQTRGVLKMLALWVSYVSINDYKKAYREPLIGLGSSPLEDALFRTEVFEQLGESRLEGAVTTDISGKMDAIAIRLDNGANEAIKKNRLHQKVATAIFFESNGGQQKGEATLPEIRLAVAEPNIDIGNVETVLETLQTTCYFLAADKNRYRFSFQPNLNKVLADRRGNIDSNKLKDRVRTEVLKVFTTGNGVEKILFPEKSSQIPDRPVLTLILLSPDYNIKDKSTLNLIDSMIKEYGTSARTFKSALIFVVPEDELTIKEQARIVLAWEEIEDDKDELRLNDEQMQQLTKSLKLAERDLKESIWRSYKNLVLLEKDNQMRSIDLGLVHSSNAPTIVKYILERLEKDGEIVSAISPNYIVKNWSPAFKEWSTKAVRDVFFASPKFPRIVDGAIIKDTIARGVSNGILGYIGSNYEPFWYSKSIDPADIEISDDMFIITGEEAKKHIEPPKLSTIIIMPSRCQIESGKMQTFSAKGLDQHNREFQIDSIKWSSTGGTINEEGVFYAGENEGNFIVKAMVEQLSGLTSVTIVKPGEVSPPDPPKRNVQLLLWDGEIPPQKWMNFYTKVLTKFVGNDGVKIHIDIEVNQKAGISNQKIDETKAALRELGLSDNFREK